MKAATIKIKDHGISKYLNRLKKQGNNPAVFLRSLGGAYKNRVQGGFKKSTDPYGTPWAPLKSRAAPPLRDTNNLMNSITYLVSGSVLRLGTNRRGAATHQFGAVIKAKDKPPKKVTAKNGKALKITLKNGAVIFRKSVMRPHMLAFKIGGRLVFAKQVTIPARPFFPDTRRGLPKSWKDDAANIFKAGAGITK